MIVALVSQRPGLRAVRRLNVAEVVRERSLWARPSCVVRVYQR
jgi:hypothetical protein